MTYANYSTHAQTGLIGAGGTIVSPNEYAPEGKATQFPNDLSVYVQKLPASEGSQLVSEDRRVADLIGNRLYLFHSPLVDSAGNITTISTTNGVLDLGLTNAKQGYIVFSTLPTADFTIAYTAATDCYSHWHMNVLQDDLMEVQDVLGPKSLSGRGGLRNLTYGLFDDPNGTMTGVAQNAVFLPYLDRDIIIGNQTDGTARDIKLGYQTDTVTLDASGIFMGSTDATKPLTMELGQSTGDVITYFGQISGHGPLDVGGSQWGAGNDRQYSGGWQGQISGDHFTGSMFRCWGDASVMGGLQVVGTIEVVHTTGQTSTVLGDWTVRDDLFVYGVSNLIGPTVTNKLTAQKNIHIESDIVADNKVGAGGVGQSLVDNLDCSEVAHTYGTVMNRRLSNSIISAPLPDGFTSPRNTMSGVHKSIYETEMVGDLWAQTGTINANAGPSGAHPYVLQLNLNEPIVSGFLDGTTTGTLDGWWAPALMDPGTTWVRIVQGNGAGYNAPIYSYTLEEHSSNHVTKLNVFCPDRGNSPLVQTNDVWQLYNPYSIPYDYIRMTDGASPTFTVSGSTDSPLRLAFEDTVRVLSAESSAYSLQTALERSVSGLAGTVGGRTGVAYILASSNGVDIENAPSFLARPVPYRLPGEIVVGEILAREAAGSTWEQMEVTAYRPGGVYDSAWLPILADTAASGRCVPKIEEDSRVYFNHHLGSDIELANLSAELYLARFDADGASTKWDNTTHVFAYGLQGQDRRHGHGLSGEFTRIPLTNVQRDGSTTARDASLFYIDGRVIGIEFDDTLDAALSGAGAAYNHMRLVVRRDA